ncbi:MAG TPA: hypothetical protein VE010_09490 [Thermoanaerobaculia bacterium]|nr:hypothetical protein [Thermoanaerobaculia bacterium]
MKSKVIAFGVASLLGVATLFAQGSGTTSGTTTTTGTATTTTGTATKTTATKKSGKVSTYQTVHHVNGVVTARSKGAVTVKIGGKSRQFTVTKSTRLVGTKAAKGTKVKISYRANTPRVAMEIRRRG